MPCPLCARFYCDHTADERGQTWEEIDIDLANASQSGRLPIQTEEPKECRRVTAMLEAPYETFIKLKERLLAGDPEICGLMRVYKIREFDGIKINEDGRAEHA